jgi:hypothetical protein
MLQVLAAATGIGGGVRQDRDVAVGLMSIQAFELFRKIRPTMPLQYVYTFLLVATHEGMTVTELSKLAEVAQTVMSRHLLDLGDRNRYMEDGMGLVTMKPDRMDMRRHQVILTPQGRALFTKWCELIRLAGSRR